VRLRARLAILTVVATALSSSSAMAQVDVEGDGDSVLVTARRNGKTTETHRARRGGAPTGVPTYIAHPELRFDEGTGETCVNVTNRRGDANSRQAQEAERRTQQLVGRFPLCVGSAPLRPSPEVVVQMLWRERVPLPRPAPIIRPGRAITGRDAFIEMGDPTTGRWHFDVYDYSIDISATSVYDVDWGDGTTSVGITSNGGPWPDGDVRHVWTTTCACDVVVTQRWSGRWTLDGTDRGVIPGVMRTRGELADFPVHQMQAVRER
jgi:hypothetical protein